jgi:tetratricopeptide (TPR) repeat protein/transglutaminase-like putative cysteine protease
MRRACLPAYAFALVCSAAGAADKPVVEPPADWVRVDPGTTPLPPANQAPLQVLLRDQQVRITTDGVETYEASRWRIQSPQGLSATGTLSFSWKPDSDVMTVHKLAVTRDGKTQDLLGKGENLTILRRENELEQSVLTGMLTAVAQPPGLQVGDVMEMSYTLRHRDPVVADSPGVFYAVPAAEIQKVRFRALWPENLPLRWRASPHMPDAQPVKKDGWMELEYRLDNPVPLLQPSRAPVRFAAMRMVEISSFADWQALSARLASQYQKTSTLAAASPLRGEVNRIRQQHAAPAQRAAAALRLVQDQIRYVLLAMNDGGLMPAAADETWKRRFGDCKAKTVLLLALLRELGIEAEPVLVSSFFTDALEGRLPEVGLFDHVLVRAVIDGKAYWLDGTRTGDRALEQIRPPDFIWGLPLTAKGSTLASIAREPLQEVQMERLLMVDARDGVDIPALFRAEVIMRGDMALTVKAAWDSIPAANREENKRSFWREQFHNLELEGTDLRFNDEQNLLTMSATGTIRLEWDPEYNTYYPQDMGLGYRADFSRPAGTDAQAPYSVQFPMYTRTREVINLPPQEQPFTLTGKDIKRTVAGTEYMRRATVRDFRFEAESTTRTIVPEFPASERAEAERVLLEMSRNDLYLKKPRNYLATLKELNLSAEKPLENANAYLDRASQYQRRQMNAEAVSDFTKALELETGNVKALLGRGALQAATGKPDAARADYQAALKQDAGSIDARRALAMLAISQHNAAEALETIAPVIEKDAASPERIIRVRAYVLQDQHELALKEIESILENNSRVADAWYFKVGELDQLGRRAEIPAVAEAMHRALKDKDVPLSASGPLFILSTSGDRAAAREMFNTLNGGKLNTFLYLQRADLQETPAEALRDIREAARADASIPALVGGATLMVRRKWFKEALALVDELEQQMAQHPLTLQLRGLALWQTGQKSQATAAFAKARTSNSEPLMHNNSCWNKATFDVALEDALLDCNAALAAKPDCGACMDSKALVLLRLGRHRESVQAYDAALKLSPSLAGSFYGRGIARLRLADSAAAQSDLQLARALEPLVALRFEHYGVKP